MATIHNEKNKQKGKENKKALKIFHDQENMYHLSK